MRKWILPEHIDDVLPEEAARLERLRRLLLDHFAANGYQLVQPPLVEYLDSLLTGTGRDLELQTFKVVDPRSGRSSMASRASPATRKSSRSSSPRSMPQACAGCISISAMWACTVRSPMPPVFPATTTAISSPRCAPRTFRR